MWPILFGFVTLLRAACVFEADGFRFDFTALEGQPLKWTNAQDQTFTLNFCATAPCGDKFASFCQMGSAGTDFNQLGTWAGAVDERGSEGKFMVRFADGSPQWCDNPRTTNFTFNCVNGPAAIVSVAEYAACQFQAAVEVPRSVCTKGVPCCTPATYSAIRMQADGSVSVFQADGTRGMWFDQNYQNSGWGLLCLLPYNRCFSFTATQCVGAAYRTAPTRCFGTDSDYQFVRQTWIGDPSMKQTVWYSNGTKSYVVTMPLESEKEDSCMAVSGNKIDTVSEFVTTPNTTFWEIPPSCVQLAQH